MRPSPSSFFLFLSAGVVLLVIPGPAVVYIVSRIIGQERSAGLVSALGIGVGTLCHVAAAALGLSALLMSSAVTFAVVKYLGAAYLIYLGIQKLRSKDSVELSDAAPKFNLRRVFAQGIVVNILERIVVFSVASSNPCFFFFPFMLSRNLGYLTCARR